MRFQFDYDLGKDSPDAFLEEARIAVRGLSTSLGPGAESGNASEAADSLLSQLGHAIAEFGKAPPNLLSLSEEHFQAHNIAVPVRFKDLCADHSFYWLRLPLVLMPVANVPFVKLQCGVEFNPDAPSNERPVTAAVFPDRATKTLLKADMALDLRLGEDLELKASATLPETDTGTASLGAGASAEVKGAGKLGISAGPFQYAWTRATIDNTGPGSEKVFWTIDDAEFLKAQASPFVIVLQVPKQAKELKMVAALQAYSKPSVWTSSLGEAWDLLTGKAKRYFNGGAPIRDTQEWDLSAMR